MMYAESQIFGATLVAPPLPNQLALTFDDGPNPAATPQLLEVLARRNVRATFFLIGNFVRLEPALTRQIAAAGHVIGNHTMTHPFLPKYAAAHILRELADCSAALEDILGQPVTLFRPPHGGRSPAVFRAANSLNLKVVQWNLIAGDWKAASSDVIVERIENGIASHRSRGRGTNVVLHDGGQAGLGQPRLKTVEAVESLLNRLGPDTAFVTPSAEGWGLASASPLTQP
jgi:peptidoglycan/xylan/chitin deacetylase (PgdA/CDA1 family)